MLPKVDPKSVMAFYNLGSGYQGTKHLHTPCPVFHVADAVCLSRWHDLAVQTKGGWTMRSRRSSPPSSSTPTTSMPSSTLVSELAWRYGRLSTWPHWSNSIPHEGIAYQDRGDLDLALSCYERAEQLEPEFQEVRRRERKGIVERQQRS
eukprot:scaffold1436_cov250-Pinguiococcus_pyrenoidosus.AAC.17